ncbi:MAG: SDR family NAD(P)-dependent oxidoreductase [Myxococcaceae bacterium]
MSQVAVVTGGCSGIGLELARELKRVGYELVLVSNHAGRLADAARELGARHTVELDLATPEGAPQLIARLDALGVDPDVFVNNAGFFFFGELADADEAKVRAMLQLHVTTPTLLARHYAAKMKARGSGHLLFTSSISAWRDFPGIALYGSTKRFLLSLATSLRSELKPWGVNVTVVAPGATLTNLYDPTIVPVGLAKRFGVMLEPGVVARAGVRAMLKRRALVVPGLLSKLFAWAAWWTPQWVIDLVRRRAPWLPRPK